ncbi:MAG: UvrB/UvrC motif-containing protein [Planctomycetota bacterium]|jgi:excinuclease UvrABC helicase subunit UvrB
MQDRRALLGHIQKLRQNMQEAAKNLDYELAAQIRDEVFRLEKLDLELS